MFRDIYCARVHELKSYKAKKNRKKERKNKNRKKVYVVERAKIQKKFMWLQYEAFELFHDMEMKPHPTMGTGEESSIERIRLFSLYDDVLTKDFSRRRSIAIHVW